MTEDINLLKNDLQDEKSEVTILRQKIQALEEGNFKMRKEKECITKELNTANGNIDKLRNELEELKSSLKTKQKRDEALAMDQHNATNKPPEPQKPIFLLIENLFVCGFEKFIERSKPYYPINIESYSEWYKIIQKSQNWYGLPFLRYPKYLFFRAFKNNQIYRNVIWESSTVISIKDVSLNLTVSTDTLKDGWTKEKVKCVVILHTTDVNECFEMWHMSDSKWKIEDVTRGHYNQNKELIICVKKR